MKQFIFLCAALTAGANAVKAIDAVNGTIYTNSTFPSDCNCLEIKNNMTITIDGVVRSRSSQCNQPFIKISAGITCTLKLKNSNSFTMNESLSSGIQLPDNSTLAIQEGGSGSLTITNTNTNARGADIGGNGGNDASYYYSSNAQPGASMGTLSIYGGAVTVNKIGGGNGGNGDDIRVRAGDCDNGRSGFNGANGGNGGNIFIYMGILTATRISGGKGGNGGEGQPGGASKAGCNNGRHGGTGGNGGNGGNGSTIKVYGGSLIADNISSGNGGNGNSGGFGSERFCQCFGVPNGGNGGRGGNGGYAGNAPQVEIYGGNVKITQNIISGTGGSGGSGGTSGGNGGSNGGGGASHTSEYGNATDKNIIIQGGNVNIPETGNYTMPTNPKSGDTSGGIVYLNKIHMGSSYANRPIKSGVIDNVRCITAPGTENAYGIKDVQTDNEGKLYFWFPNRWGEN